MYKPAAIMLVEDQKLFRDGIVRLVEPRDNLEIIGQAENGVEFFKMLEIKRPEVVLLDLEMPEMSGSETLDILKKVYPEIKVIIVSQYHDVTLIKDLFNRGANAYIPKTTDWEIMVKAIHEVKSKGFYLDNIPELGLQITKKLKIPFFKLLYSKREREIILLLCEGRQAQDIARKLNIASKTVETNLTEIYRKAQVKNRSEFLVYAIKEGINYLGTV